VVEAKNKASNIRPEKPDATRSTMRAPCTE
jgi:hypothetical protein